MQVSEVNDIKIYNLSHGKTIPEWLSDRKKRLLLKKDVDLRRRIQLIQDLEMPAVSHGIQVSGDGQYVIATGVYKPRVRCYDVNQLAMKFERCFDEEVVKFNVLSEDYTKLVFLFVDRYVELHSQFGRYYRIRIPHFGRDMTYNTSSCDLYFVGDSSQVYRLNLEVGSFLKPFDTTCISFNTCALNPHHNLFVCGSHEGMVEAFDPRSKSRVAVLDCGLNSVTTETSVEGMPSVTHIAFKDALHMAVGTATGQVLMYDIRANKPYFVKDHRYGLPIKDIEFIDGLDLIASMDSKIIKIWNRQTGEPYTAIQADSDFNDICIVPNTGMMFVANEAPKILSYYMPSIGPAPKWCAFLDRITEELEESTENTIYDDYKFVTQKELEELGLTQLMGTNLLRAYMHGFFLDIRLYHKAKASSNPFAYEEYRKKKIKEKMDSERGDRVVVKSSLPKVNSELAQRLAEESQNKTSKSSKKSKPDLLSDDRFKDIFSNPDFEINEQSDEYKLLHPVVNKLSKPQTKSSEESMAKYIHNFEEIGSDEDMKGSSDSDSESEEESESESSDDNHNWTEEVKQNYRQMMRDGNRSEESTSRPANAKFYQLKADKTFANINDMNTNSARNASKASFEERLKNMESNNELTRSGSASSGSAYGNRVMTYEPKANKRGSKHKEELQKHLSERKRVARTAKGIRFTKQTKMF